MTSNLRISIARTAVVGLIAGASALAGAGVASAAPEAPATGPSLTNPWGGNSVPIKFHAVSNCLPEFQLQPGQGPEHLWVAMDDALPYNPVNLDFSPALTTTTLEVDWTNHDTGQSGHASAQGQAYHREVQAETGPGHVTGTARMTAGILPLPSGSALGSLNNSTEVPVDVVIEPCG